MKKFYSEMLIAGSIALLTATTGITAAHASFQSGETRSPKTEIVEEERTSERKTTAVEDDGILSTPITASSDAVVTFERIMIPVPGPSKETLAAQKKAKEKAVADAKAKAEAELKAKADAEAKAKAELKAKADAKAKAEAEALALSQSLAAAQPPATSSQNPGRTQPSETQANIVSNPNAYQRYAGQELARRGLGGNQELGCLVQLWERESNWNPNAANPTSTARGIPQKMMDVHHGPGWKTDPSALEYLSNPQAQINWGIEYIQGRYGTACAALSHSNANNWY